MVAVAVSTLPPKPYPVASHHCPWREYTLQGVEGVVQVLMFASESDGEHYLRETHEKSNCSEF